MRLLILAFLCALFLFVTPCPTEEDIAPITKLLFDKFNKDICGQGIKPGGEADANFLKKVILPYYISKKWLGRAPPPGFLREQDRIIAKYHKNTYNYCNEADREAAGECFQGAESSLLLKYGATAMLYCPILDKKIANWDTDDKPQALRFFTQYCKTKGKTC